jgi:hypothetical protein
MNGFELVQWYNGTMVQWYNGTMVQWYNGTMVQWYNLQFTVYSLQFTVYSLQFLYSFEWFRVGTMVSNEFKTHQARVFCQNQSPNDKRY